MCLAAVDDNNGDPGLAEMTMDSHNKMQHPPQAAVHDPGDDVFQALMRSIDVEEFCNSQDSNTDQVLHGNTCWLSRIFGLDRPVQHNEVSFLCGDYLELNDLIDPAPSASGSGVNGASDLSFDENSEMQAIPTLTWNINCNINVSPFRGSHQSLLKPPTPGSLGGPSLQNSLNTTVSVAIAISHGKPLKASAGLFKEQPPDGSSSAQGSVDDGSSASSNATRNGRKRKAAVEIKKPGNALAFKFRSRFDEY